MGEASGDLRALGACWAEETATDLTGLFGVEVGISAPELESGERDDLLPRSGEIVCSKCAVQGEAGASVWFVVSQRAAQMLAAAASGTGADDFEAFCARPFDGEIAGAHREAMDLCAGILGRVLDEEAGLPGVQLQESTVVELARPSNGLPPGGYCRARFPLAIEGFPRETLDLFFDSALAARWFGASVASPAGAPSATSMDLPIGLVDPCSESRECFARMVQELGGRAVLVDPEELHGEAFDDLLETSWVVSAWELGGRSGMDLLERLQAHEAAKEIPFALACAAPTRAMVEAALRWGAQTVLYQPWDADEIRERLFQA